MNKLPTEDHQILADSIRRFRVLWKMSTRLELAEKAGVPVNVVEFAEKGVGPRPTKEDLKKVTKVLKFTGEHVEHINRLIDSVLSVPVVTKVFQPPVPQAIIDQPLTFAERRMRGGRTP